MKISNQWKRMPMLVTGILLISADALAQQLSVPRIDQMPDMPTPYQMRNWKLVAMGYDSLAFDLARSGQYLPLVFLNQNTVNYPGQVSFGLHTYVGDGRSQTGEAINVLPAVVGATLCGLDKSGQYGRNWALMCQEYFNNRPAENVYLNAPVTSSGSDWWYDVMSNVFFYQLSSAYPGTGEFQRQFTSVADRWLQAVFAMGGSLTPWSHPSLEHRGWRLATMTPNNQLPHEPEAGGSIAWLLYHAAVTTGEREYRYGAELCMEELNAYSTNPAYELQLSYGTYLAARMNGELGTNYDVAKFVNWCFDVSPIRSWGAMVGTWGGYSCSGLIGEVNGNNDYAFAMNTFEQIGALVPLVRYDPRFARAIGKWVLNAANASRLFYGDYLPDANQDSRAWSKQYDPSSLIAHEALRQEGPGLVSPYATGDAIAGGWAPTNLSLYSSSHVGILGAVIDTTEVPRILRLDLLKTDYFHAAAYPTFLYFNPDSAAHSVQIQVGPGSHDVYDAASKTFLLRGVSGTTRLSLPPREAVVAVISPAAGTVSYDEERMLINGVVVDYRSGHIPLNHRPRIKGLGAAPSLLYLGGATQLHCTAVDRDGDSISYVWSGPAGAINGTGPAVTWTAPASKGSFDLTCRIVDAQGGSDTAQVTVTVVDSALSVPVIQDLFARPGKVDRGASTTVFCRASDPKGALLSYTWSAAAGSILGRDSAIQWTAPTLEGNWYIVCSVDNGRGGRATDSVLIPVRDFTKVGSGSLILSLPLNGNTNDVSGYNNQGIPADLIFVADRYGTANHACGFNGATSSLRVSNSSTLNCDSSITVGLWMKAGLFFNREMFLISHGSWQNRWKISITPERKVRWTVKTATGVKDVDSRTVVAASTYYFVTGVYNGADLELYIDGEFESFTGWSGTLLKTNIDLTVGQMLPTDANYNFQGVIDDISLHNYALTYPEVQDLHQTVTGVPGSTDLSIPCQTALLGNYPNPFNPDTEIRFQIGGREGENPGGTLMMKGDVPWVNLRVYDLMGREVATLVEGPLAPGRYSARFDGKGLASGVYLCRLSAGAHVESSKMLLLR